MSNPLDIKQPFSNIQLELLKLYSEKVSDEDLLAIKSLISKYFLERAKDEADKVWKEKSWNSNELLKKHRRTPYRKQQP